MTSRVSGLGCSRDARVRKLQVSGALENQVDVGPKRFQRPVCIRASPSFWSRFKIRPGFTDLGEPRVLYEYDITRNAK